MSNTTNFTGLEGKDFLLALKPLIRQKLPKLNSALSDGHGKWAVEERRFVFRYAPPSYRREELMLRLFRQEDLSPEETLLLELLEEAQGFRQVLIEESRSAGAWDAIGSDDDDDESCGSGLTLYLQDWWTTTYRKVKRTHSGIEIVFLAAEAPEEPEEEEAPATSSPGWGESS